MWELNRDEVELLAESCRCLDQLEALREAIDADGVTVPGSEGQPRVHPAISQMNATRGLLGKLLAQLGLPDPEGAAVPSASSVRARKAAESRWSRHTPRGA